MNGRLYDPLLRRFLNADENIQDQENTQIYNKYGYVANNPLLFNDPSGEIFGIDDIIISGLIIGAMIGAASYTLAILVNTGSLRQWSVFDFGKSIIIGGISGAATAGIGNMFESAHGAFQSLTGAAKYLTQGGMHGLSQGFFAIVDGNGSGFFQGFISGALGSLAASGWASAIGKVGAANGGMIAFGALSGGIGAELSGGNFFKGFLQGGIVAGLNHAMNHIGDSLSFKNQKELDNYINENVGPKDKIEAEAKTKILLATDANLDKDGNGYNLDWSGNMSDSKGYGVAGFTTVPDKNGFTSTFIAPRAKSNYPLMTIVHELVHSYGHVKGFHNTEGVARTYTVAYLKAYNANPALIHSYRFKGMNNYDSQSSWRKLLPNYINTGLKR